MGLSSYIPEFISVTIIAIFMSISPGADFVMITKNSLLHQRRAGLYSALGISVAIWLHVTYCIAGLALIIANSVFLFSIIQYVGAAYLIFMGWKTFRATSNIAIETQQEGNSLSDIAAFRMGFITNALNPKTTLFFLSIFTQVVDSQTPLMIQVSYGVIISLAHLIWFSFVAICFTHPVMLTRFNDHKVLIERLVGCVLIVFGLKVAFG